jgi:hypothetical protein
VGSVLVAGGTLVHLGGQITGVMCLQGQMVQLL